MVSIASLDTVALLNGSTTRNSLKRKHVDSETPDCTLQSSQPKRLRVAFDPDIQVRVLEDWNDKPLDLVREEVRRGVEKHAAGDSIGYDQVKQLFAVIPTSDEAPSTHLLRKYLLALISNTKSLNKSCSGLVHTILDCSWLAREDGFVDLYVRFLGALMSAQGGYIKAVFEMLVRFFNELPSPANRHPTDPVVRRSQLRSRVHQSLKYLLHLIPTASGVLSPILSSLFPFSTDTTKTHINYVQHLLQVTRYAPELKGEILALITDRLVKIDVQVQVDMEELEDDTEDNVVRDMPDNRLEANNSDDDSDNDSDAGSVSSEESLDEEEQRLKHLRDSICTMDGILDVLFGYYEPIFSSGSEYEIDDAFAHLTSQFSNTILPTYRTRHTQFLLFHFAQASADLTERFAVVCAQLSFEKSHHHNLRLAAAAYLASFIARGAHVSTSIVRDVFNLLCERLDDMRRAQEPDCRGPDLRLYQPYYSLAQALLYIFCFRWRDLIERSPDSTDADDDDLIFNGGDIQWGPGLKEIMTRNVYSKFNPLKVCSPTIVSQFARIAHHLRFMYVYPLLETNKRLRLARSLTSTAKYDTIIARETALSANVSQSSYQLDAYFPFDPYTLPKSKRWIDGDYVEWKSIPGLDDEADDEDADDDADDDVEESDSSDDDEEDHDNEVYEEDTETQSSGA